MEYITDLSVCVPSSALARDVQSGCWQIIPYETVDPEVNGFMLGTSSFNEGPEIRLPLNISGWHAVYVGLWNPHHDYDGGMTVKIKLSDDPAFIRISEAEPPLDYQGTWLAESFFKTADLTGRDIVFAKVGGPFAKKAYIAYVKLVPLSKNEIEAFKKDAARKDTSILQASIDGYSYFHSNEYRTREHLLEMVERYRNSDVGKVIWDFNYGDLTLYPSKVGQLFSSPLEKVDHPPIIPYLLGEKACADGLKKFISQGIVPQAVVARHVHEMGLKFDAMFRPGNGGIPPARWPGGDFIKSHPEFHQVLQDGTVIEKGSFAFPEVREIFLAIIREVAEEYDIDGAQLCFVRGVHYLQYEKPVLDDFRSAYGEDGTKVKFWDPRMQKVRARYMTDYVRDVRRVLNEVGTKKGKKIELAAWIGTSHIPYIMDGAMDILTWLRQGLMDSIISYSDLNSAQADALLDGNSREIIETAHANGCKYIRAFNVRDYSAEHMVALAKACLAGYDQGVDGFAIWDIDAGQDFISGNRQWWSLAGRLGHREEVESFLRETFTSGNPPANHSIRLKTLGKHNLLGGFADVVYSGG